MDLSHGHVIELVHLQIQQVDGVTDHPSPYSSHEAIYLYWLGDQPKTHERADLHESHVFLSLIDLLRRKDT